MKYVVGSSIYYDRDEAVKAAIEWWATACGTHDAGDPAEWREDEVMKYLPGWCKVKAEPGEEMDIEYEQEDLDNEVVDRALRMIHDSRMKER